MEKAEKESGEEREKPDQQKKFHGKKQQKGNNKHSCVTSPTFWLNDVSGRHPKHPEIALENPSTASEP